MRLALRNLLFDGERPVGQLVELSDLSLANASQHLGPLHRVGWVARRKEGQNVVYSLADERAQQLGDIRCGRVRWLAAVEATIAAPRWRAAR